MPLKDAVSSPDSNKAKEVVRRPVQSRKSPISLYQHGLECQQQQVLTYIQRGTVSGCRFKVLTNTGCD